MLVPHHHGVNARHFGQVQARVLHGGRVGGTVEPAVQQCHHDVGALGAQLGHIFGGGLYGAFGVNLAFEVALVPVLMPGVVKPITPTLMGSFTSLPSAPLAVKVRSRMV